MANEIRCRLCAQTCNSHIEIMEDNRFKTMLDYFFQLKINLEDKLPTVVCENCYGYVERVWNFKEQVDQAQILLMEVLNTVEVSLRTNKLDPEEQEAKREKTKDLLNDITLCPEEVKLVDLEQNVVSQQRNAHRVQKKKKRPKIIKKSSLNNDDTETFKDIEFVNPDGSVTPKSGIGSWNTYQWICSECSMICFDSETLREHYTTNHNIISVRYLCVDCPKVYSKYSSFLSHVRHHRPLLKFTCDVCYKWYATAREVQEHQIIHNEADPYQCPVCGKRFRLQSLLNVHTRSHLPSNVKNCYSCSHCPKKFGTKPNLMAHKRIHLGIKEYTCDQCGKSFVQKGNLDNHLLTHNSARPFHCTVCDKSFKSLVRLRKHDSIHSGLKPYQCDICGRQFRERGTLKEHHRIHTGAMPFTCEFCGKCFRFKGVLTTHRRQHTGERPYSCTECQHHFTNWPNYNKHMKRRHGINTSVNCRTKQEIPPTGKPHRNPPGTVLAAPQPPAAQTVCQDGAASLEVHSNATTQQVFYPVIGIGLYGIPDDIMKNVV
ncbi:hypothetical protein ABEB36_011971 [Hypothenemus hampei]|uniref:Zinc finger protein 865 n=1 Tax=Hypothenemus hampei TaxID=57062 RepID=A0ABD1E9M3_HYPHA